ncbi:MAG TPA: sugar transferase [Bryobacterales bacterium]|jgi:sugar transferase (PEP-CTERM system associated)|nr:sugar transferase [Bryobacterales bacterium]
MIQIFNQYTSLKLLALMMIEALLIFISILFSGRFLDVWNQGEPPVRFCLEALGLLILVQTAFYCNNLYDFSQRRPRRLELLYILQSIAAAVVIVGLASPLIPGRILGDRVLAGAFLLTVGSVCLVRISVNKVWPNVLVSQNVAILGSGELAEAVARELLARRDLNARLVGFVGNVTRPMLGRPVLGGYEDLSAIASRHQISRIIVAMEDWRGALPTSELMKVRVSGVAVEDAHSALAALTGRVWLVAVRPSWLSLFVMSGGFRRSRLRGGIKRATDICFGVLGLIVTLPLQLAVALAVLIQSGRPVIYRQVRVGLRGKCFELLKFRSMRVDAEMDGRAQWAQRDDPRITRVGRFIRKYRLDELPQFINVIRGDMSFVGPRPERPYFVEQLKSKLSYYELRHMVRPGITGWAQVRHNYTASLEDSLRKLEYDLFYLKNMSFLFDCSIVFQSIRTVLLGLGGP